MRPCLATPTSNLEGWWGLGCTQGWGRLAAPPRAGPQASGRGQRPSQATCGRGTPARERTRGPGCPPCSGGLAPVRPCPFQPRADRKDAPRMQLTPPHPPPAPSRTTCRAPAEGAGGPGQWVAPSGTWRSSQGGLHPHKQECPQAAPGNPSPAPARRATPRLRVKPGRLAGSRKEDGAAPAATQGHPRWPCLRGEQDGRR